MNSRLIIVYLENDNNQISSFCGFLNSLFSIQVEDTDLLVYHHKKINTSIFPKKINTCSIYFKEYSPKDDFYEKYKFAKSISCITENEFSYFNYDLILKTDVDVFLTPKWNSYYPLLFSVGKGGYNNANDIVIQENLNLVQSHYNIQKRNDYKINLGSTWYGNTDLILQCARLATDITKHIFNSFNETEGKWPSWYRGVSSMYASEIAINNIVPQFIIDGENLDYASTSNNNINQHAHIHCWHTDKDFSKSKFYSKKYQEPCIENTEIIKNYCLFNMQKEFNFLYSSDTKNLTSDYIYIVCSLPRTGTTSICKMANELKLKPMHVLNENFKQSVERGYNFFADTPFYSPEFLIAILQYVDKVKLIYIDRPLEEVKKSFFSSKITEYLTEYTSFQSDKLHLHDAICYQQIHHNPDFLNNHKSYMQDIASNYNIDLLLYNFEDGWKPFCDFINTDYVPSIPIPHLHKSSSSIANS